MQSNSEIQTHAYRVSMGEVERRKIMHKIYTAIDPLTMLFSPTLEAAFEQIEVWLARRERRARLQRAQQTIPTALSAAA